MKFTENVLHSNKSGSTGFDALKIVILTLKTRNILKSRKKLKNWKGYWMQIHANLRRICGIIRSNPTRHFRTFRNIGNETKGNKLRKKRTEADRRGKVFMHISIAASTIKKTGCLHYIVTRFKDPLLNNPKKKNHIDIPDTHQHQSRICTVSCSIHFTSLQVVI